VLLAIDRLPFGSSKVSSTLYYWWFNYQKVQDSGEVASMSVRRDHPLLLSGEPDGSAARRLRNAST
jgi:hypothetical protein